MSPAAQAVIGIARTPARRKWLRGPSRRIVRSVPLRLAPDAARRGSGRKRGKPGSWGCQPQAQLVRLTDPDRVFTGLPAVDAWQHDGPAGYVLAVSDPAAAAPAATRALVAAGADVLSISESRHSLEDVYLELIGHDQEARRR